jgi:glycosyltransferase involved in cell wall biosynthesis
VSKKDRVLIISAVFPPEPVVSAMLSRDIAEKLSQYYKVTVLCPKPTRPIGYSFPEKYKNDSMPYEVVQLPSFTSPESNILNRLKESKSFGKHCAEYIAQHKDEILAVYANAWPLFSQKAIVKSTRKYNIPSVLHIQDIYPESFAEKLPFIFNWVISLLYLPLDKYILKSASHIIGISHSMISYLSSSRGIPLHKFSMVRNWQNDEAFVQFLPSVSRRNEFVFMYVGSIAPSAGLDNVIRAYHIISDEHTKLIIAGNGAEKNRCILIARDLNLKSIEFLEIAPEKVPELQSSADVLLLPLKKGIAKTATPSKLTAYLLSAKPVIACVEKNTDVAEIITKGQCGMIVEPEEINKLADVMLEARNLPQETLLLMGKRSREFALEELSKEVNISKLISIIESQIHHNNGDKTT